MIKIFDFILFDNNLDLLKLRILEFKDVVGNFVIVPMSENSKNYLDDLKEFFLEFKEQVIIIDVFQNTKLLYNDVMTVLKDNYELFDDLIFFSKETELPNFNDVENIIEEVKFRNLFLIHSTFCWNYDFYFKNFEVGTFVTTFTKFIRNPHAFNPLWRNKEQNIKSNHEKIKNGWRFLNFHEPTEDEIFARENLLPSVIFNPATTYRLIKRPLNFELPKNIGILAYNKIGRDYMKKHLFLVELDNDSNLNEVRKLYDTVSIIGFSDNVNEVIAENIGESVYKSILHLPNNVLYGEKPLKDFQEDYKKNEIKRIVETVFPQDQDNIRIIYRGFDDFVGLWETLKNKKFSEIINPS
jgi:hypothetical protein